MAVYNVKDYGAVGDGNSHPLSNYYGSLAAAQVDYPHATSLSNEIDWAAAQKAINLIAGTGGEILWPDGLYLTDQSHVVPSDVGTDGYIYTMVGQSMSRILNVASANKPTFKHWGGLPGASTVQASGFYTRNLILLGKNGFPNHGIHLRASIQGAHENLILNMNGSGIYIDGGVFEIVFRQIKIWPAGSRDYGATSDGHTYSGILLEERNVDVAAWSATTTYSQGDLVRSGGNTYVSTTGSNLNHVPPNGAYWALLTTYAFTLTFDDIQVNNGGRGIQIKPTFGTSWDWRIGRCLMEGLTGGVADGETNGNGWALDLDSLRYSEIGPIYGEFNSPGSVGDANDKYMNIAGCVGLNIKGGHATGKVVVRNSTRIRFSSMEFQSFDADNSTSEITLQDVSYGLFSSSGTFANSGVDPVEINVRRADGGVIRPLKLYQGLSLNRNALGDMANQFLGTTATTRGTLSVATSTSVTFLASGSFLPGLYLVSTFIANLGSAYQVSGIFSWDGTTGVLTKLQTGANADIVYTVGVGLRARQTSGSTRTVTWAVQRIA